MKRYRCVKDFEVAGEYFKTEVISAGTEWEEQIWPYKLERRLVNEDGDLLCIKKQLFEECFEEIPDGEDSDELVAREGLRAMKELEERAGTEKAGAVYTR